MIALPVSSPLPSSVALPPGTSSPSVRTTSTAYPLSALRGDSDAGRAFISPQSGLMTQLVPCRGVRGCVPTWQQRGSSRRHFTVTSRGFLEVGASLPSSAFTRPLVLNDMLVSFQNSVFTSCRVAYCAPLCCQKLILIYSTTVYSIEKNQ